MTITIPTWLLWAVSIPLGLLIMVILIIAGMGFFAIVKMLKVGYWQ